VTRERIKLRKNVRRNYVHVNMDVTVQRIARIALTCSASRGKNDACVCVRVRVCVCVCVCVCMR